MDSLISAGARALAAGDVLAALNCVALRDDPPALALRGIALAQLGELVRSRELLRRAARGFGAREAQARARCVLAEAEVALALREIGPASRGLEAATAELAARGDRANAQHGQWIAVRHRLLLGRLADAAHALQALQAQPLASPTLAVLVALTEAEIALRSLRVDDAAAALARAAAAARQAAVPPALAAEVAQTRALLDQPAARCWQADAGPQPLRLAEVQALLASGALVVDACRRGLRAGHIALPLSRRPLLFTLARVLAEHAPAQAPREVLIERAFRQRQPDDSHRARLRVEMGRLRALAAPLADIAATPRGYQLLPHSPQGLVLLLPPLDGDEGALQALLADGAAWSTSALALALGESQRGVQRALASLQAAARVQSVGRGRAQRWLASPMAGITTILLLPAALPFA